ncbi:MAG: PD40 domain-containing protein, partial [Sedimentisphaerales bacterium]|nr:PD40 domain-containing protein [Sedimentisphaerales bacterium]
GSNHENMPQGVFSGESTLLPRSLAFATAFLAIFLLVGCSGWLNTPPQSPVVETNLYGNLDAWQPVGFTSTPFSSLVQHSFCEEGGDYDPDISGDGKWIVFSSLRHAPNPDLYVKQVSGSTATRLTSDPASEIQPCFSPLGDKVAYASNRTGNWDIWVISVDGSNPVRLTDGASNDIHPSWSPDGKQIVYCSLGGRSNQWELWIVNVDTPSIKKWIGYGVFPEWCPNASIPKIAYQMARYRGSQWFSIWTVDMIDGEAKFPTEIATSINHACICPTWHPDGKKIAYSTVTRNIYEKDAPEVMPGMSGEDIWIVDLDGRNSLRLTQGDAANFAPCWAPDGRIYFCSDRKGIDNIWSAKPLQVDFAATSPVDLSKHPQGPVLAN